MGTVTSTSRPPPISSQPRASGVDVVGNPPAECGAGGDPGENGPDDRRCGFERQADIGGEQADSEDLEHDDLPRRRTRARRRARGSEPARDSTEGVGSLARIGAVLARAIQHFGISSSASTASTTLGAWLGRDLCGCPIFGLCAGCSSRDGSETARPTIVVGDAPLELQPTGSRWFERAFAAPTPAQAQAWPAIARGEHVLVSAPTGSGKTLAAFLWALDRLSGDAGRGPRAEPLRAGTRVVYISPLKALAYDIERNLRAPLRGIGAGGAVRVGIRTGDTPQRERAAMLRKPPDILDHDARVAVPDPHLAGARDAERRRGGDRGRDPRGGALQARLAPRADARAPARRWRRQRREMQRIGLSATQSPLEEIGALPGRAPTRR